MDKRLEKILVDKYPVIFRDYGGDMRQTCMAWGMDCGDGWFKLIDDMCEQVTKLIENKPYKVIASQVKEKFGGLRFYYTVEQAHINLFQKICYNFRVWMFKRMWGRFYWGLVNFRKKFYKTISEKIDDIISEAESKSYKICETCGQPGQTRGGAWIYTACDNCEKLFHENKNEPRCVIKDKMTSVYDLMFGKDNDPVD